MKKINIFNINFYQSEIEFSLSKDSKAVKQFVNCNFDSILYNSCLEIRGNFRNCVFNNGNFTNLKVSGTFENCTFVGSKFEDVVFDGAEFQRCNFSGTIFINPTGLHSCAFKETCLFVHSQGLSISKPITDEGILIVCKSVCAGQAGAIEKAQQEIEGDGPYDVYELDSARPTYAPRDGRTRYGRRAIGFKASRCQNNNHDRNKNIRDESAVLICSRKDLV